MATTFLSQLEPDRNQGIKATFKSVCLGVNPSVSRICQLRAHLATLALE